jgi:hypothetical protein
LTSPTPAQLPAVAVSTGHIVYQLMNRGVQDQISILLHSVIKGAKNILPPLGNEALIAAAKQQKTGQKERKRG